MKFLLASLLNSKILWKIFMKAGYNLTHTAHRRNSIKADGTEFWKRLSEQSFGFSNFKNQRET